MSKALLKKHVIASQHSSILVLMAHYGFTTDNIIYVYIQEHTHKFMGTLKTDQQIQDVHRTFVGQFSSAKNIQ